MIGAGLLLGAASGSNRPVEYLIEDTVLEGMFFNRSGAALVSDELSKMVMNNVTIQNNTATVNYGGVWIGGSQSTNSFSSGLFLDSNSALRFNCPDNLVNDNPAAGFNVTGFAPPGLAGAACPLPSPSSTPSISVSVSVTASNSPSSSVTGSTSSSPSASASVASAASTSTSPSASAGAVASYSASASVSTSASGAGNAMPSASPSSSPLPVSSSLVSVGSPRFYVPLMSCLLLLSLLR